MCIVCHKKATIIGERDNVLSRMAIISLSSAVTAVLMEVMVFVLVATIWTVNRLGHIILSFCWALGF